MKKMIIMLTWMLACTGTFSQNRAIDQLFDKYAGKDGFTTVDISNGLLTLASWMENDEDSKDLLKGLDHVRILALEDDDQLEMSGINFWKEMMASFPQSEYKELMTVKEKDQDVKMFIKEEQGTIHELIIIVGGSDNALICITGKINLKDISDAKMFVPKN
jgi:hypothetical protein